ncbi:helix-turn-helix domain-containing protein [Xanthobacter sp. DSM 24535]|uniref:LexA family protein n=1 Tax=Roseixanthobacter psychrophilus TaxID=3119917 RepID=UPI00372A8FF7
MTPKQRDALRVISTAIASDGCSPTYDQIAAALGLRNKSGVHRLVNGLIERGLLERETETGVRRRVLRLTGQTARLNGELIRIDPTLAADLTRFAAEKGVTADQAGADAIRQFLTIGQAAE